MRVLVTTATKHGSTLEVADAIAAELTAAGIEAVRQAPGGVKALDGFDAVVIGSPAYMGHWLDDAKKLVERESTTLRERPVWLFTCGPIADPPKSEEDPEDVQVMLAASGAREHRLFGGKLERSKLGLIEKAMIRALRVKDADNRDFDDIRAWGREIAAALGSLPSKG